MAPTPLTKLRIFRAADGFQGTFHFLNLAVDATVLRPIDKASDCAIVLRLPPQHIAEGALVTDLDGHVDTYISGESQVVARFRSTFFTSPGNDYTCDEEVLLGLLREGISGFPFPPGYPAPPADPVANDPQLETAYTAIELPYRMTFSPIEMFKGTAQAHQCIPMPKPVDVQPGDAVQHPPRPLWHALIKRVPGQAEVPTPHDIIDPMDVPAPPFPENSPEDALLRVVWTRDADPSYPKTATLGGAIDEHAVGAPLSSETDHDHTITIRQELVQLMTQTFASDPADVDRAFHAPTAIVSPFGGTLVGRYQAPVPDPAAFSVLEWEHFASWARDRYAKIVQLVQLYPTGHYALQIEIFAREFVSKPGEASDVAGLQPFLFLAPLERVVQADKVNHPRMPAAQIGIAPSFRLSPPLQVSATTAASSSSLTRYALVSDGSDFEMPFTAVDHLQRPYSFTHPIATMPVLSAAAADAQSLLDALGTAYGAWQRTIPALTTIASNVNANARIAVAGYSQVVWLCLTGGTTGDGTLPIFQSDLNSLKTGIDIRSLVGRSYTFNGGTAVVRLLPTSLNSIWLDGSEIGFVPKEDPNQVLADVKSSLPTVALNLAPPNFVSLASERVLFDLVLDNAVVQLPSLKQLGIPDNATFTAITPIQSIQFPFTADNAQKIFASIVAPGLDVSPGDLLGKTGLASPNMPVVAISDLTGAVAGVRSDMGTLGTAMNALNEYKFDPSAIFNQFAGDAIPKLLGLFPLKDIIEADVDAIPTHVIPPPVINAVRSAVADGTLTRTATYSYESTTLKPWPQDSSGPVVLSPASGARLDFGATIVAKLHPQSSTPISASAKLAVTVYNFTLTVFQTLIIDFASFSVTLDRDQGASVDPKISDMSFKGSLAFFTQLLQSLGFGGFSVTQYLDRLEAAMSTKIPAFNAGAFCMQNLSVDAGLKLPILPKPPRISLSIASRTAPFSLTVAGFGGGGFFELDGSFDGSDIDIQFSIEFGAFVGISLGVASGSVEIKGGIWVEKGTSTFNVTGYFRIAGCVDVLGLITASIVLYLALSYVDGDLYGEASLTIEISICFFSISVKITARRRLAGSGSSSGSTEAFASEISARALRAPTASAVAPVADDIRFAQIMSKTDWNTYVSSFA